MQDVHREERARLRTGRDAGERGREHQQEARRRSPSPARVPPRSGPAPRGEPRVRPARCRPVRACPGCPAGAPRSPRPARPRRAAPRGTRGAAGRSAPGPRSPARRRRLGMAPRCGGAGERGRHELASDHERRREREVERGTHGGASYRAGRAEIRRILMGPHERGHRSPPGGTPATGGPSGPPATTRPPIRPRPGLLQADRRAPAHPGDPGDRRSSPPPCSPLRSPPPGFGVNEIRSRLDALGSDFTRIPRFPERSTIYAADGSVLTRVYLDNREIVPLDAISRATQRAVLAIEDSDFFQHGALDVSSLIRAIDRERAGGRGGPGWLDDHAAAGRQHPRARTAFDQSIEGKLQELALAIRVEQRYSKERIFELYLNQVYMGNGVYGFGTASQFYFRKPARELTLLEGATLAGHDPGARVLRPDRPPEEDAASPRRRPQADGGARVDQRGTRRPGSRRSRSGCPNDAGKLTPPASSVLREVPDRPDHREQLGRVHGAREDREGAPADALRGRPRHPHHARARTGSRGPRKRRGSRCGCRSTRRPARRLPTSRS